FKIKKTLRDALRRLRKRSDPRALWIDAICINQIDAQEKSSQLALLGRIYSNAAEVLIWLG
ncbi:hypothetical protein CERZMDRAFT_8174, partial [Cercospora zeae-maydis SCOH1-5]